MNRKFQSIVNQMVDATRCDMLHEEQVSELNAIFSHWLQNKEIRLPLLQMDHPAFKEIKVFSRHKHLQQNVVQEKDNLYQATMEHLFSDIPYPPPKESNYTFIDLFAGIGGFRLAFQKAGGRCLFSSEWDKFAKQTYAANFGEIPYGDIQKIDKKDIPQHDILCAGFPCQPFSLAGVSKKNSLGRKHGFEDETQGTLFFDIKEILQHKRPKAFMLENVKNLISHDKGRTFEVIRQTLENQLGYIINWKIVDGAKWVPQHRERIFIVGYDPNQVEITKEEIIIPDKPSAGYKYLQLKDIIKSGVEDHTVGPGTWETLKRHKAHHAKIGNGFGYGMINMPVALDSITRTISARYHKDGAEILIEQNGDRPRRLMISEAMQLQGYDPDKFIFPVSKTQAYRQIGNSVVVPAITECAMEIASALKKRAK